MKCFVRLLLAGALLFDAPLVQAGPTVISRVHHTVSTCASSSCTVTIPATTTGNLIVVTAIFYPSATGRITSTTGETTISSGYTCKNTVPTSPSTTDVWYQLSAAGGVTTMTVNGSDTLYGVAIYEYSYPGHYWTLDTGAHLDSATTNNSNLNNPALTTSLSNDVIVTSINPNASANSTSVTGTGWTNPVVDTLAGDPINDALNVSAGFSNISTYTDDQASDSYCSVAVAFGPAKPSGFRILQ